MIQIVVTYVIAAIIYVCTRKDYPYYKAFQMGVVNLYCYILLWNSTYLMGKESFAYLNAGDDNFDLCILCVVLCGCMGGIAFFLIFCSTDMPIAQFWHDYKYINDDEYAPRPRLSYSLFKKMRKLQPEYFEEVTGAFGDRIHYLKYHGIPYGMTLLDYILAMLYISSEEKHHNTKRSDMERDLYAIMQADLDKQLDSIVKDRDAALRSVEKAARETQDILANMAKE